ncbi:MAG: LPS export ABC transporter periplasmic protein LptC [Burkholderiaceae bacterium]|nr:LPS export ABC transporter periplasmic protein LptC [Burkholderiaceae bacterium]
MKGRTEDRLAAAVSIVLLLILAGGSYFLAEFATDRGALSGTRRITHEPDYFVDGLVLTKVNERGEPAFRLSAERMVHYPDDGRSEFTQPRMVSLDSTRAQVELRARTGSTDARGDETELSDGVVLVRHGGGADPDLVVKTEALVLSTKSEIAHTSHRVEIKHGTTSLTGVGMEFDNATRHLRLESRVRGSWQPAQPPS